MCTGSCRERKKVAHQSGTASASVGSMSFPVGGGAGSAIAVTLVRHLSQLFVPLVGVEVVFVLVVDDLVEHTRDIFERDSVR